MQTRILIAGMLVIAAMGLAGAEPTQEPEWTLERDCEQKEIQAFKAVTTATVQTEAELALLKAQAYGQLKRLVSQC